MTYRIAICFLLVAVCAFSDPGNYYSAGNTGILLPIKNNDIALLDEQLDIKVCTGLDKMNFRYPDSINCDVKCVFAFQNLSDKPISAIMGFPITSNTYNERWNNQTKSGPNQYKKETVSSFIVSDGDINIPTEESTSFAKTPQYDFDTIIQFAINFNPDEKKYISISYTENIPRRDFSGGSTSSLYRISYILRTVNLWQCESFKMVLSLTLLKPILTTTYDLHNERQVVYHAPQTIKYYFNGAPSRDFSFSFCGVGIDDDLTDVKRLVEDSIKYRQNDKLSVFLSQLKSSGWNAFNYALFRKAIFEAANNAYFNFDYSTALILFGQAFDYSDSLYELFSLKEFEYGNWTKFTREPVDLAPSYYIAYNLACCYSLLGNFDDSSLWLSAATQIYPSLKKDAENDSDLLALKKSRPLEFSRIVNH